MTVWKWSAMFLSAHRRDIEGLPYYYFENHRAALTEGEEVNHPKDFFVCVFWFDILKKKKQMVWGQACFIAEDCGDGMQEGVCLCCQRKIALEYPTNTKTVSTVGHSTSVSHQCSCLV